MKEIAQNSTEDLLVNSGNSTTTLLLKNIVGNNTQPVSALRLKLKPSPETELKDGFKWGGNSSDAVSIPSKSDPYDVVSFCSDYLLSVDLTDLAKLIPTEEIKVLLETIKIEPNSAEALENFKKALSVKDLKVQESMNSAEEVKKLEERVRRFFSLDFKKIGLAVVTAGLVYKFIFVGGSVPPPTIITPPLATMAPNFFSVQASTSVFIATAFAATARIITKILFKR
jgi:hypothetical protein